MYVLRIEIEIKGVDDADARQQALKVAAEVEEWNAEPGFPDVAMKLQKRYENKPPRNVRFP